MRRPVVVHAVLGKRCETQRLWGWLAHGSLGSLMTAVLACGMAGAALGAAELGDGLHSTVMPQQSALHC